MSTISLAQLLSTCMDASYQGCQTIRNFQKQQGDAAIKGTLKETNEIRSVVTQADIDTQNVILNGLRNTWGSNTLRIIGEEDEQHNDGSRSHVYRHSSTRLASPPSLFLVRHYKQKQQSVGRQRTCSNGLV